MRLNYRIHGSMYMLQGSPRSPTHQDILTKLDSYYVVALNVFRVRITFCKMLGIHTTPDYRIHLYVLPHFIDRLFVAPPPQAQHRR